MSYCKCTCLALALALANASTFSSSLTLWHCAAIVHVQGTLDVRLQYNRLLLCSVKLSCQQLPHIGRMPRVTYKKAMMKACCSDRLGHFIIISAQVDYRNFRSIHWSWKPTNEKSSLRRVVLQDLNKTASQVCCISKCKVFNQKLQQSHASRRTPLLSLVLPAKHASSDGTTVEE